MKASQSMAFTIRIREVLLMEYGEKAKEIAQQVEGRLIVSCQAKMDSPLAFPYHLAAIAKAAEIGGAAGIRANGPNNVSAIARAVSIPIFDCHKREYPGYDVYITPTRNEATESARHGANVIVIDGTKRKRPDRETVENLIEFIHDNLGLPVMADISILEEGLHCVDCGADFVATTLSGYTDYSRPPEGPDLDLVERLAYRVRVPVIAEGRYKTPEMAKRALTKGAHAVVVGTAITAPNAITTWYCQALHDR